MAPLLLHSSCAAASAFFYNEENRSVARALPYFTLQIPSCTHSTTNPPTPICTMFPTTQRCENDCIQPHLAAATAVQAGAWPGKCWSARWLADDVNHPCFLFWLFLKLATKISQKNWCKFFDPPPSEGGLWVVGVSHRVRRWV